MPIPTADESIAALRALIRELLPYVLVQDGGRLGPEASDDEATADLHQAAQDLVAQEYTPVLRADPNGAQLRALIRRMAVADNEPELARLLQRAQDLANQADIP